MRSSNENQYWQLEWLPYCGSVYCGSKTASGNTLLIVPVDYSKNRTRTLNPNCQHNITMNKEYGAIFVTMESSWMDVSYDTCLQQWAVYPLIEALKVDVMILMVKMMDITKWF